MTAPPGGDLSGVWQCDDGGLYYIRQGEDGSITWAGLHDSGFHKGIEFANVFRGWLSEDAGTIAGEWSDVPRGGTTGSGTIVVGIWDYAAGRRLVRIDETGGFGGRIWQPTGSLLEPQNIADLAGRVRRYDVALGDNNPPCRDFTVMWGAVWQPKGPTLPPYFPYDYCAFVGWVDTADGPTYVGWGGDGDFTFNFTPLWDTIYPNGTDPGDFWNYGWVTEQPSEFSEKPVTLIARQYEEWERFHCEAAMFGRENYAWPDCEAEPRNLLPGWNEQSGWSVLVNGRPVEGRLTVVNPDDTENRYLSFAVGPDGLTVNLRADTVARVTGVIADDAGHDSKISPEIHPVYAIDIPQDFTVREEPATLSGVWHGSDNGTYYVRQLGSEVWWLGLSRDQGRSFANVFRGTVSEQGPIEGQWIDVRMGTGGVLSGGELVLDGDHPVNPQASTTLNKAEQTANFGASMWTKIYDTAGIPLLPGPPVGGSADPDFLAGLPDYGLGNSSQSSGASPGPAAGMMAA
jgi:hypothetical protein